ncbi:unnamed protein product [Closterium sp. NIES-53]
MVAGIRVKGEPDEVLGCPTCMQAKFTRYPFSSSEATAKAPLDEVVMDVVGPLKLGAAGAEYFLTIVDVYTRMTWVYVLSKKSDVADTETARGLLIEAGLPDYFWPDAVRSACVAKNRALTHVGADKWVPYVEWIGRKPRVDMLRVFGCMCMALVPKHLQHNKLGAKAIWAVHLGMAQNSKGWLLWDPFTKKFLVSRDCIFMKNMMFMDWKAENEAKIGMRFGEVKSSSLEHVELPLEQSNGSTTTRQSSLVNGGEEAKDAEEEEEEVQQLSERAPTLPSRTTSAPRIRPAKSALAGAALIVGDDEESDYDECAFAFFSPVEMPGEPATLKEALESIDAEEWKTAMESELKSIEENGTWELVELPEGHKAITSKWLFKIKSDADGKIERYKSRLVANEYQQKEKVDYKELFAPVVKPTMLRTLLTSAANKGWVVKQMDVTTAFLNGILEEEIFMAQPEGFDDGSGRVWKLKKALYGLKQAPRQWYLKLREVLEEIGFTPSSANHSLFMLGEGEQKSFMVAYVDEILIFSPSSDLVKEVMLKIQDMFKCKALGDVSFYLGLHIKRDVEKRCMWVHQRKYLEALAANFGQSEGHVATPFPSGFKCVKGPEEESVGEEERHRFHSLVGSLMYTAVNTRPDIPFATGQFARVVQCPNEEQVAAGMRVVKYLGQTPTVWLQYLAAAQRRQKGADGVEPGRLFLTAFSDASYASEPEDMTSVGGFICCIGGGPTAWESKKQVDQALSSVESEYMALFRAVREIVWQRCLLDELGEEQQGPTPLYCDSQGAIPLAKNPVLHGLTKHMRVCAAVFQELKEEFTLKNQSLGFKYPSVHSIFRSRHVQASCDNNTGAISADFGGAARPRTYYVPLLQQVLSLPPPPGPSPSLLSPPLVQSQSLLQPASSLPGPSPYSGPTRGLTERRERESRLASPVSFPASPESRPMSPVFPIRTGRCVPRQRPPPVPGTHSMTLRPSTAPQSVPLPSTPATSLPALADLESDSLRTTSLTVTRLLATAVTDPSFESTAASALVAELVDFAALCRLDYAASLVADSASVCPPSVEGECALGTDVLEDRQEEFECFAAAVPHLVSMLLATEGDPDAPDIPTPRT